MKKIFRSRKKTSSGGGGMFWDKVAGVYDVFVNVINRKTHQKLKKIVPDLIGPDDTVLECACGTGLLSSVIAAGNVRIKL